MDGRGSREEFWQRERATWPHHELSCFVEAGGIRWHLQRTGSGPALLLVHGTGASTHSWRELLPLLGEHCSVLAVDLPGHGFTDPLPATHRSIRGMSECLAALLRRLAIEPEYCVGHSAGAVVLCRMALDGHVRPQVIISINGAFLPLRGAAGRVFSPIAQWLASSSLLPRLLARHADNPANVARVLAGTGSLLDAPGVELYRRLVRNPRHIAGALGMMGGWDLDAFSTELPRLPVPLVFMVGAGDRTVPPDQALQLQRRVPKSRLIVLPNLGHLAHEEAPSMVAGRVVEICRGAEPP